MYYCYILNISVGVTKKRWLQSKPGRNLKNQIKCKADLDAFTNTTICTYTLFRSKFPAIRFLENCDRKCLLNKVRQFECSWCKSAFQLYLIWNVFSLKLGTPISGKMQLTFGAC
jgi:hypothetical protein